MAVSEPRYEPRLSRKSIAQAARQHHAMWGAGRTPGEHQARVFEQLERGSGLMRYAGLLDASGQLLCSAKVYRLRLFSPLGEHPAVGLGTVSTPDRERGRGHASKLVRAVLDEGRQQGADAALLFSDIGVELYQRLGFRALAAPQAQCELRRLPSGGSELELEVVDDAADLLALHGADRRDDELRLARDRDSARYWFWRNGARTHLMRAAGRTVGYAVTSLSGETLWIDELCTPDAAIPQVWRAIRQLAEEHDATRVAGWLARARLTEGFVSRPRRRCIPMLAALRRNLAEALPAWGSHFSSIDHF
jgi:hypothetical protein